MIKSASPAKAGQKSAGAEKPLLQARERSQQATEPNLLRGAGMVLRHGSLVGDSVELRWMIRMTHQIGMANAKGFTLLPLATTESARQTDCCARGEQPSP